MKEVNLSRGKVAIVDDSDFDFINQWKWFCNHHGYAVRNIRLEDGKRMVVFMHRLLMGDPKNMQVDHINRDSLDNRRSNLRICTNQQNTMNRGMQKNNTSGYKGVYYYRPTNKFKAIVKLNGKQYSFGYHDTAEEAAMAYNEGVRKLHGSFAFVNNLS